MHRRPCVDFKTISRQTSEPTHFSMFLGVLSGSRITQCGEVPIECLENVAQRCRHASKNIDDSLVVFQVLNEMLQSNLQRCHVGGFRFPQVGEDKPFGKAALKDWNPFGGWGHCQRCHQSQSTRGNDECHGTCLLLFLRHEHNIRRGPIKNTPSGTWCSICSQGRHPPAKQEGRIPSRIPQMPQSFKTSWKDATSWSVRFRILPSEARASWSGSTRRLSRTPTSASGGVCGMSVHLLRHFWTQRYKVRKRVISRSAPSLSSRVIFLHLWGVCTSKRSYVARILLVLAIDIFKRRRRGNISNRDHAEVRRGRQRIALSFPNYFTLAPTTNVLKSL